MKPNLLFICLLIGTFLLFAACQNEKVKSEQITVFETNRFENTPVSPTPEMILDKDKEISFEENFSSGEVLEFNGYRLEREKVVKELKEENLKADIFDTVLKKNKKTVARFEGVFYPLGNLMDFGSVSLFDDEKQFFVIDTSNRYERDWIFSVKPEYRLHFDSRDYQILRGSLAKIDFDRDGVYEITLTKEEFNIFSYPNSEVPRIRIIFKYDRPTQRYLPASHLFPEFTLDGLHEQIDRFNQKERKLLSEVLEITLVYIYAGKEDEGWKFFDENFVTYEFSGEKIEDEEQAKQKIKKYLAGNPVYRFINKQTSKK